MMEATVTLEPRWKGESQPHLVHTERQVHTRPKPSVHIHCSQNLFYTSTNQERCCDCRGLRMDHVSCHVDSTWLSLGSQGTQTLHSMQMVQELAKVQRACDGRC